MDKGLHEEMIANLDRLVQDHMIQGRQIYLFGHCNATEELADVLLARGFTVTAILDNHEAKQGKRYGGIEIRHPREVLNQPSHETLVCIVARAYAAMAAQLRHMGYDGPIEKLVDYNSYAEYSLSGETMDRMRQRVERGSRLLERMKETHPGRFILLCPFSALGDIYLMMAYLPGFLEKRGIGGCVVGVVGKACGEVAGLFGAYEVEVYVQKDMDAMIQAALYAEDKNVFIPHQDRPYVVNLSQVLYIKKIPLEQLYCCGVYGLPASARPASPVCLRNYERIEDIKAGRSVILSPYAKSVTTLSSDVWDSVVNSFRKRGYQCYTNVAGEEKPLPGTLPIGPAISEIQSVAERAGIFIGIRSGLCDVLREAACRKVALYPDYFYCDTQWKAIEMYALEGWENIVVKEGFRWKEMN